MIEMEWEGMEGEIGALMARFAELPRHIAKKHLKAAMKRVLKPGVPTLRRNTPPLSTRRGRARLGEKRTTGKLRRAVKTKAGYKGTNAAGSVYGVLGYQAGFESQKAIWQEFGTKGGVKPKRMVAKTMEQIGKPAAEALAREMKAALEKAAKELASGMNPTRVYSAGGSWRPG
jgi:HK97 gp10 family phage protein